MKETWIEVFKGGTQTDAKGNEHNWSDSELDKIVSTYNNQDVHEAPVVIGHPETNSPAYGWVSKMKKQGDKLLANITQCSNEFMDWVKAGMYKKRSIALGVTIDGVPNPYMVRHIGFLGAVPPAIKGLKDPQFADGEFQEFETNEPASPFDVDIPAQTPEPEYTPEQKARSEKYNIGIKPNFRDVEDKLEQDYGDPVNFKFPLTPGSIKGSLATFNRPEVQSQYTGNEALIIASRLVSSARENKVSLEPYKWAYAEISVDPNDLSKKQLVNHIIKKAIANNPQIVNNYKESRMDDATFQQLRDEFTAWLTGVAGEEITTQAAAKLVELAEKYMQAQPEQAPPADTQANDPRVERLTMELNEVNRKLRYSDNEKYFETLLSEQKVVPAQKDIVLTALEFAEQLPSFEFAENGKKTQYTGAQVIRKLLESNQSLGILNESHATVNFASPGQLPVDAEFADIQNIDGERLLLHNKVIKYAEENKCSYDEALQRLK